jgi:creatinine amidohydrolase
MRIADMNWMQVQAHAATDDRAILPIGSTEQHAYLSLAVDTILAERLAIEAAEPLRVPVFPVQAYGLTPSFVAYPGTITLRMATFCALLQDVLDGIVRAGFKRILIVNGHGGNIPGHAAVHEWLGTHPGIQVKWHNWWTAPKTSACATRIDPVATHASWLENFAWTRLPGVTLPAEPKAPVDMVHFQQLDPEGKKLWLGDGSYGGHYQRSDAEMAAVWSVAVEETRALLTEGW